MTRTNYNRGPRAAGKGTTIARSNILDQSLTNLAYQVSIEDAKKQKQKTVKRPSLSCISDDEVRDLRCLWDILDQAKTRFNNYAITLSDKHGVTVNYLRAIADGRTRSDVI